MISCIYCRITFQFHFLFEAHITCSVSTCYWRLHRTAA